MAYDRQKVIDIAVAEVGYLEKSKQAYRANAAIIHQKTLGAGSDNITKYGYEMHEIYPSAMDFPAAWCDAFVDWCFYKAYGVATAKSLLCGNFDDYTVASAKMFKAKNALDHTPKVGDQIFFSKSVLVDGIYHTGLVIEVSADGKTVTTIEGNTSATGSGIEPNGGCVAKKTRSVTTRTFFGHPNYGNEEVKTVSQYAAQVIGVSSYLNIRTGPSTSYAVAQAGGKDLVLPNGAIIAIDKESGKWGHLVNAAGKDGWVNLIYIKKQQ